MGKININLCKEKKKKRKTQVILQYNKLKQEEFHCRSEKPKYKLKRIKKHG